MKKKQITVFIEGQKPIKVSITTKTTVEMLLKKFKLLDKSTSTYTSADLERPRSSVFNSKTFTKPVSYYNTNKKPDFDETKSLWVGFTPIGKEVKFEYNWVGNKRKEVTEDEFIEHFNKYCCYREPGFYDCRGIKHKKLDSCMKLYRKTFEVYNKII